MSQVGNKVISKPKGIPVSGGGGEGGVGEERHGRGESALG